MTDTTELTAPAVAPDANEVDRLKAGIELTQANLAETVAELQRKLSPSHAVDKMKQTARERARQLSETSRTAAQAAVQTARARADEWSTVASERATVMSRQARSRLDENPTPLVLIGAGVTSILWHVVRRRVRTARIHAEWRE
jgi:ElaB/YqjD/DUF883 family membrane-anchored ribosome-binding protein